MDLCREHFGNDFAWGVSTAAYQIEGAHLTNGKGPSIWDEFTSRKGRIRNNENANISCDFYHNYHQDLALMRSMNIPNFRFSLSWARIFPEGIGAVNRAGVDFYKRMIDFCHELEIEPWVTLYHWDLPLALERKGGWTNREVINWFSDYVEFCIKTFGDAVNHWMILNEPMVFTGAGYFLGIHAPGRKGMNNFLAAAHHAALCQAEGGRIIRTLNPHVKIGTTFSCSQITPLTSAELDQVAAAKMDLILNRMFIEPLLGLGYPHWELKPLQRIEQFIKQGDEQKLAFAMDFIGVQNYTREVACHSYFTPLLQAKIVRADLRNCDYTEMKWEVYPESIYHVLRKFGSYPNMPGLIVTENGAAFTDQIEDGRINDQKRKDYLQQYIAQVHRAIQEGVNVKGYFVWSFSDNFEWAEGYTPRFGLVYIDYPTQKRIVKASGQWYGKFLGTTTTSQPAKITSPSLMRN